MGILVAGEMARDGRSEGNSAWQCLHLEAMDVFIALQLGHLILYRGKYYQESWQKEPPRKKAQYLI